VSTLVLLHAHPDDESIATGGTIARAVSEGHRVVLVVATDGRHGEVPADLEPGETLVHRRRHETENSAAILGVAEVRWLGYHDSGMTGWPQNEEPGAFMRADLDEAARRFADIVDAVGGDVITCYDWHGGYGHPDHIQVHRVGHRAAEILAARGRVVRLFESTMNRTRIARMMNENAGEGEGFDPDAPADDGNPFGSTEDEITMAVDVSAFVEAKRASMACHASQITDQSFFLQMPPDVFSMAFGIEWFIEPGRPGGAAPGWFW
jgi:LmbE family N-acetylglucosaminyl deacetylase